MIVFVLIFTILLSADSQYAATRKDRQNYVDNTTTLRPHYAQTQQVHRTTNVDIEYRLTRLEVLLGEKLENLKTEVRETSRRLQAVEWQSAESQSTLEGLRADLNRFAQQVPSAPVNPVHYGNALLEQKVDNLAKGIQILVVATRTLNSDMGVLKKNVSTLVNETRSLVRSTSNLVTKQFFNHGLLDLKHHQISPWIQKQTSCSPTSESSTTVPKNCKEIQESGHTRSGIYRIQPEHSSKAFMVVCDLETNGGGWTVIHNRYEGTQDFYQNWHDYKYGFGNLGGEFWLGLDNIHLITGYNVNELLIELQDLELQNKTAHYSAFSVGPEIEGYPLKVLGGYSGNAGDSLMYHAGNRFSTKDMDQDGWPEGSCAQAHGGAWWYRSCDMSNLNGRYLSGELPEQYIYQGMYWGEFRGAQYSLLKARMLVRPREQVTPLLLDEIFNTNSDSIPKAERETVPALRYDKR